MCVCFVVEAPLAAKILHWDLVRTVMLPMTSTACANQVLKYQAEPGKRNLCFFRPLRVTSGSSPPLNSKSDFLPGITVVGCPASDMQLLLAPSLGTTSLSSSALVRRNPETLHKLETLKA